MALGLHFGAQPARAVALAVVSKRAVHGYLPARLNGRQLPTALPGIVRGRGHAQHLAELTHRHLTGPLANVLVGAHRVGWLKMRWSSYAGQSWDIV